MKRLLLLLLLASSAAHAQASWSSTAQGIAVDDQPPAGMPKYIYVQNVPLGSGVPQVGAASGFTRADYVRDGLYHVPGYLPYTPSVDTPAQVIQLPCKRLPDHSAVICDGYTINPQIGRGENILIQPVLAR